MAAVAFTETLVLIGARDGKTIHLPLSVSDVVDAFAQTEAGDNYITIGTDQNYMLKDIIVVVGGTDTNFQDIFVNGQRSSLRISNKSNLNTSNNRQFQTAPIVFAAGAQIKLKQAA